MTNQTYTDRLTAYGYTPEQIKQFSDDNTRKLRALNAMNTAGRERGTVDRNADLANFKAALNR